MLRPEPADARVALGAVRGAFVAGGGFDQLQSAVFDAIALQVFELDPADPVEALTADDVLAIRPPVDVRVMAVSLMAVLEFVAHPLPAAAADGVTAYARRLGMDPPAVKAARDLAHHHTLVMYADLQRSSWYTEETIRGILGGHFRELLRSKLAYEGVAPDPDIARRWQALRDCPPGSWGRGVADFYVARGFPFPGDAHGIYEIGARHDFVHVLADYDTDAEGEIDVFAFIAGSMPAASGVSLLAVTLGLFQNGSIHRVAGREVKIARTDTLSDPGAIDHFADALRRGTLTTHDVMGGIDHFAYAARPLDEVRAELNVVPKRTAAPAPP